VSVPTLVVEFAPTNDPLETSPTWVDITAYVRWQSARIQRGRSSESESFSPGTFSCTLDNRDRRFDPRHATGPYYGNLLPGKQIRVRALWSAVYYPLFQGFIEGWPQEYADGKEDATVPLSAVDALSLLAEMEQPDTLNTYIRTTVGSVLAWWRFVAGQTWVDVVGGNSLTATPAGNANPTTLMPATAGSSELAGSPQSSTITGGIWERPAFSTAAPWSLALWFRSTIVHPPAGGSATTVDKSISIAGATPTVSLIDAAAVVALGTDDQFGALTVNDGTATTTVARHVNDGRWHHVAVVVEASITRLYLDGVQVATDTHSGDAADLSYLSITATAHDGTTGVIAPESGGAMQDPMFFNKVLSATEVQGIYDRTRGYLAESTTARAGRLLDAVSWPASWRDLTGGPEALCGDYTPYRRMTLAELQIVEATEQGRLFISADGKVTLQGRYHNLEVGRGLNVQATFSDDGSDIRYRQVATDYDRREVINEIAVTGSANIEPGGAFAHAEDSTSITAHGRRTRSLNTLLTSDGLCDDMADGILLYRKNPTTRTRGPIEVQGAGQPTQWPTLLGLLIGDRVRHEITPLTGAQAVLVCSIEGIGWDITAEDWLASFDVVPIPGGAVAAETFLILDDTTYGKLDTGRLGF
jgi:hypothetical protein